MTLALVLAVTLSAGNAEFDKTALDGAAEIAVGRVCAELAEKGPPSGSLEKAMLEGGAKFASREEAKKLCRGVFDAAVEREYETRVRGIRERLGLQNTNERESGESSRNASGGLGETPSLRDTFAGIRFIREDSRSEAGGLEQNANERESGESSRNASGGLGETPSLRDPFAGIRFIREDSRSEALFEKAFEAERAAACAEQAKTISGAVKPSEGEFEAKDEATLRREMTAKVAAQQKTAVFEENLKYISETIVDPVIDSAKKEMRRQGEYLTRTKCEAYAPSALAKEIEANLRKNVAERKAKESDPAKAWDVFPKTLAQGLPAAVGRRTLERVVKNVDDVKVALEPDDILRTIRSAPEAHRKASESEQVFRGVFTAQVLSGALERALDEAPAKERDEFAAYVKAHAASPEIVRAVETRVRREVLPQWRKVREAAAKAEADRIWPSLGDGTWYPDAEFADAVAARSDYAAAVRDWRKAPGMAELAAADGGRPVMEETAASADRAVSAAFDLARSAIAAQNAIVGEVEPSVLGEAKDRKSSFWRATPDFKAIVGMLTEAVEAKWGEKREATLWGDGTRPANADEQHAGLFPSVRKRIELVARQILEDMEKPEPEPEKKPEPDPEKPEDPTESDQASEEPQLLTYSIVVQRDGDTVSVKLEQGKSTVAERSAKAKMSDYQGAMKFVSDKLGADILRLK